MRIGLLDIGGTAVKYGLWEDGALVSRGRFPTEGGRGAQDLLDRAAGMLGELLPLDAVGVSARGQITGEGAVYFDTAEIAGWSGTPVAAELRGRLGLPVAVENDANCMALGESVFGAGRGLRDVLCAAFGTGVGGGLVLEQRLYRGRHGFAGEIGLMPWRGGVWEDYASVAALIRLAHERDPALRDGVALCAHLGERAADEALGIWLDDVCGGLRALTHVLDPEGIVLGGGLMRDARISALVAERVRAGLFPGFEPVVLPAALGGDAMLLGAAAAAQSLLAER